MSEKIAQLEKKGGGDFKETILWSNPNPTSSFDGVDIDLSESIESFKYIKIYFRISTTNATEGSVIYEKDVFKTYTGAATNGLCGAISARQSSTNYFRRLAYATSTRVTFLNTVIAGGGYYSSYLIPLKICGLK